MGFVETTGKMAHINDEELENVKNNVADMRSRLEKIENTLKNVTGQPGIRGYGAKLFDLSENLNVVNLLKRISDAEDRITVLETP